MWRRWPCKAHDEDGFHCCSSLYCRTPETWHLVLGAAQHDTEFRAAGHELCHFCALNSALAGQASDIRALVPLEIVNPMRFSSSAICFLRAGWLIANHSAVPKKFSSSDKTETARRRRSPSNLREHYFGGCQPPPNERNTPTAARAASARFSAN
jgi:hypothetical protein